MGHDKSGRLRYISFSLICALRDRVLISRFFPSFLEPRLFLPHSLSFPLVLPFVSPTPLRVAFLRDARGSKKDRRETRRIRLSFHCERNKRNWRKSPLPRRYSLSTVAPRCPFFSSGSFPRPARRLRVFLRRSLEFVFRGG